jgi:antitoxin VapB
LLILRNGKKFILANNVEMPRLLTEEVSETDFEPIEIAWQDERSAKNPIIGIAKKLSADGGPVALDVALNGHADTIENLIAQCRYRLTSNEIERMRMLGYDAGKAMGSITEKIRPGMTELELATRIDAEFATKNIVAVVNLVAADARLERFRHPVPTENRWEKLVMLVACAKRDGLIVSLSRLVCAGTIPAETKRRTEAVARVNARLRKATQSGRTGSDLYNAAASAYDKLGYADEINKHHQGGACGYRTRDWVAHPASCEKVFENQAFAWNPSITGTKVEETGIVTPDGFEIITTTPDFPQIAICEDGREFLSPGILSI